MSEILNLTSKKGSFFQTGNYHLWVNQPVLKTSTKDPSAVPSYPRAQIGHIHFVANHANLPWGQKSILCLMRVFEIYILVFTVPVTLLARPRLSRNKHDILLGISFFICLGLNYFSPLVKNIV